MLIFHNNIKNKKKLYQHIIHLYSEFQRDWFRSLRAKAIQIWKKSPKNEQKKPRVFPICEIIIYDWIIVFDKIVWHYYFSCFDRIWIEKDYKYLGCLPFRFFLICKIYRGFPFFFQYLSTFYCWSTIFECINLFISEKKYLHQNKPIG